jgi:hypothetical protein
VSPEALTLLRRVDWRNDLGSWLRYRPHDPANQLVAGFHAYNTQSCVTVACWSHTVGPVAHHVPMVTTERALSRAWKGSGLGGVSPLGRPELVHLWLLSLR